jgi:hypothetical protein
MWLFKKPIKVPELTFKEKMLKHLNKPIIAWEIKKESGAYPGRVTEYNQIKGTLMSVADNAIKIGDEWFSIGYGVGEISNYKIIDV